MLFYKQLDTCSSSHINIDTKSVGSVILFIFIPIEIVHSNKRNRINLKSFVISADKTLNNRNISCSKYIKKSEKLSLLFYSFEVHRASRKKCGQDFVCRFVTFVKCHFFFQRKAWFLLVCD